MLRCAAQYDIDLVHKIEELIGKQLEAYQCDEGEVLKGITKVSGGISGILGCNGGC